MKDAQADDRNDVRSWVVQVMQKLETDPTGLARSAGIAQSTLSRYLRGESESLSIRTIEQIAAVSEVAAPQPIRKLLDQRRSIARERGVNKATAKDEDGLPVWGTHPVERDGAFHFNTEPVSILRRPPSLADARRAIAFYAPDETMSPRWRMGELVVADMVRPGTIGGFVIVELTPTHDPNALEVYLFRRYDGRKNGRIFLSCLHEGSADEPISLDRVLQVRRVLDWNDLVA